MISAELLAQVETHVNRVLGAELIGWQHGVVGEFDAGIVLWRKKKFTFEGREFGTHFWRVDETPEGEKVSLHWGHYDLTLEQAVIDYTERVGE